MPLAQIHRRRDAISARQCGICCCLYGSYPKRAPTGEVVTNVPSTMPGESYAADQYEPFHGWQFSGNLGTPPLLGCCFYSRSQPSTHIPFSATKPLSIRPGTVRSNRCCSNDSRLPPSDELTQAHAFAYGGCIIQDLGYYPFGSKFFSDLTHYVRSGDFILNLIRDSQDLE